MPLKNLSNVLKICLQGTFVLGVLVIVFLHPILKQIYLRYFIMDDFYYCVCLVALTLCGICSLNIIWQLIALMDSIQQENPFVHQNVKGLKRIAFSAFGISILFFILNFFDISILALAVGYVFFIAGFTAIVLSELFRKAIDYKNENDFTI